LKPVTLRERLMRIKKERRLPTVRRTSEQVARDIINYANCMECNEPLLKRTKVRDAPKMCSSCRGDKTSENTKIKELFKEMQENPTEPAEDEMSFADEKFSKWAGKRDAMEVGRIIIQSTSISSWGVSALSELMTTSDTNQHRHKKKEA
tara:strand:+ start:91 stop:537 length:447 start_codon:yes stop_codon:yes gene_type:complete